MAPGGRIFQFHGPLPTRIIGSVFDLHDQAEWKRTYAKFARQYKVITILVPKAIESATHASGFPLPGVKPTLFHRRRRIKAPTWAIAEAHKTAKPSNAAVAAVMACNNSARKFGRCLNGLGLANLPENVRSFRNRPGFCHKDAQENQAMRAIVCTRENIGSGCQAGRPAYSIM